MKRSLMSPVGRWVRSGLFCLGLSATAYAVNPQPSQIYYIPFPEDNQLTGFSAVSADADNPVAVFITFACIGTNTVIYYDHWENGYEPDIANPIQANTLIFGDGILTNGVAPGYPTDILPVGALFSLTNTVDTTTLQAVIDFDARDKVGATRPVAITKTTYSLGTLSLLAGCFEVFEAGLWGLDYRSPVGVNLADSVDAAMFSYTALSIMAGAPGTTVRVDADNNGVFETTNTLAQGQTLYVANVNVGGRVLADKPVQVVLFTGRPGSDYQSRDSSLTPTNRWSSSYFAPVSTPATGVDGFASQTVVFLYNPNAFSITVTNRYRTGTNTYSNTAITVAAGTTVKSTALVNGNAHNFFTTGSLFYAFCAVDANNTDTAGNQAWDGGFALIGQPSLSTQVLLGLGIGRDPFSGTNPSENGNPVYATTAGNGNTLERVYVDYNGDNAGASTDPNGNKYDAHYDVRELDRLKLFDPDGNQGGMLLYVLNSNANVKIAAAWAQDPGVASPGQPGVDVATAIPPLREGDATKTSTLATDADADGFLSPGDTMEYDIRVINTARAPIPGPFTVKDTVPSNTVYVANSTRYRVTTGGVWNAWVPVPDSGTTAFPLDEGGFAIPGVLGYGQEVQLVFEATVDLYPDLDPGTTKIINTGTVEVSPYGVVIPLYWEDPLHGSIGNWVWYDTNSDGLQNDGETGVNGVTVRLLNSDGTQAFDGDGFPLTTVTANDPISGNPGYYLFNGVLGGSYIVEFVPPGGYKFTPKNADAQGVSGPSNSDANLADGRTDVFALASGEKTLHVDAGLQYELRIDKQSDVVGNTAFNNVITYTIVVTNSGLHTHTDVTVSDPVPWGTVFVPNSVTAYLTPISPDVITTQIFNSATGTVTVPAGVTNLTVETWGGGGRGGSRTSSGDGGGGGGGAYSRSVLAVTPGGTFYITVGSGSSSDATPGGDSWFSTNATAGGALVLAKGGATVPVNTTAGAAGGAAAAGLGTVKFSGGSGANAAGGDGGGGGSSAGTAAAGANGSGSAGGVAPAGGGNGGDGRTGSNGNGNPGFAPGGGGGGSRAGITDRLGGNGANGRVVVTYSTPGPYVGTIGNPPNLASNWTLIPGATLTLTFQATVVINTPTAITNTVSVVSDQQLTPLTDRVIDPLVPTLVVITAVRSRVENGVAIISWDVDVELDTAGYYLERWLDGAWVRVHPDLIPAQLFVPGTKTYEQADPGAPLGTTQRYRIVELDNSGRLIPYGPYDLALDGGEVSYETWAAGIAWGGRDSSRTADPDGDGLTNFQEYVAGTDPLSANSVLRVSRVEAVEGGLRLSWSSEPDRTYAVEMALTLSGPYLAVATDLAATPPENQLVLPVSSDTQAYFRVLVIEP